MKIILATGNKGKVREIGMIFSDLDIEFVGLDTLKNPPQLIEDGHTFAENAAKKARPIYEATGHTILSEDSGLVVDALNGRPGIHSARFAGPKAVDSDNIVKLLSMMEGVEDARRTARFVSVFCLIMNGKEGFFDGFVEGRIIHSPAGTNGFGYDPVFVPNGYDMTFGELDDSVKNSISHRAMAFGKLRGVLTAGMGRQA